jgi:hypothetical protein
MTLGLIATFLILSGCYQYAYHRRTPQRPFDRIAIDHQTPLTATRWSYFWGLLNEEPWSPGRQQPPGAVCQGKGAGKVEVGMPWYGMPLMLVTLGIAVPNEITIYCTTYRELDASP